MKTKSTTVHQKLMAMAIVAMFAMCAFSVCLATDSDAGPYGGVVPGEGSTDTDEKYDVNISVGQTFTYSNLTTNLDSAEGKVTLEGSRETIDGGTSATVKDGFTIGDLTSSKTVTGSFLTPGEFIYKITAEWNYEPKEGTTLTQTATQTLTFYVAEEIILPTDANGYGIKGKSTPVLKVPYRGPIDDEVTVKIGTYSGNEITGAIAGTDSTFSAAINGNKLEIAPIGPVINEVKTYVFDVTVTDKDSKAYDTMHVVYYVFDTVVIETDGPKYTYEGDDDPPTGITFSTNWDTGINEEIQSLTTNLETTTTSGSTENSPLSIADSSSDRTVTISGISTAGVGKYVSSDSTKAVYNIKFTATGTVTNSGENGEESNPVTKESYVETSLTVYKALAFSSKPTNDSNIITPITAAGTSISLSSYITGAYSVIFDWGDGTQTQPMDNNGKVATTYGAFHTYVKSGLYTITVYATNDHGTTTSQIMYKAESDSITLPTEDTNSDDSDKKSFFDEHGYQFLIFAILTILLLVAFFFFGIQNPVVILAAIVTAALAVLCYVYNDIGGVIDAVKGLFGKA